jgi:hypothetical protein
MDLCGGSGSTAGSYSAVMLLDQRDRHLRKLDSLCHAHGNLGL